MSDPTKRFARRVDNYVKYRPGYPPEIIGLLQRECRLTSASVIADLGSGPGFLTELFLKNGNRVFGIEPNAEMRHAGDQLLSHYPAFASRDAPAEATTLPDQSVDFVTAAQAFHWFDREKVKVEFQRILKPNGWVVIIWNNFRVEGSPLTAAYQDLVNKYGTDYSAVRHELVSKDIELFFAPNPCHVAVFQFQQTFDYEGLKGRLLSSSYAPEAGDPRFEPMLRDLEQAFAEHQKEGKVSFEYETEVYYGQVH